MTDFYAYKKMGNSRYREAFGLDFEDFQSGQCFYHRPGLTVSQQDNRNEATETMNNAMLHYDAHYAQQTEWSLCLGVSTLTLQIILGVTWKTFYKKSHILSYHDIAMTRPVFGGDTLYAQSKILGTSSGTHPDLGEVEVMTEAVNQKQETVAKIHYTILIYKRGKFPEDEASSKLDEPRFLAYHLSNDGLIEKSGLFYEDFLPGETYEHRPGKTFFEAEIWQHATRALNWHPCYTNQDYMNKFCAGKLQVPDSYLLGVVTALTTRTFGRVVANLGWTDTQMLQAVYQGDSLYVESTILEKRESHSRPDQGILKVKTEAWNQDHEKILSFDRCFLVYKTKQGPYSKAGYA